MDEVIDDLISLESGFNDGGLDCMEPNIIMQNNVSMNHTNFCSNSCTLTLFKMLQTINGMKVFSIDYCNTYYLASHSLQLGICQVTFLR